MNLFTSTIIAIVNFLPVTGTRYHGKECHANSYKKEYIYIYIEGKYKGKKQKDKGQCFNLWFVNCYCLEIAIDV